MTPNCRITLIVRDPALAGHLAIRLQSKGYQVMPLHDLQSALGLIYSDPPDIIIAELATSDQPLLDFIKEIKDDSYFSKIPVIGLLDTEFINSWDWSILPLDDYLLLPLSYAELFRRIGLSRVRIQRVFDNNPLTRLPGNTSIQHAIERSLGEPMAVCYIDINHFKPYNDKYGFAHGDEVLRMLGRIMYNTVKDSGGGFCGHIGGDDFVFIVPEQHAEPVSANIINNFTAIIADLFDDEEKSNGFYVGINRQGITENIPLLGISIAIVPTSAPAMQHAGKVAEVAAELKKLAKQSERSCYVTDRRCLTANESEAGAAA